MKSALIDAGPLIALFDRDDEYHGPTVEFLKHFEGKLITTWPVITEASYMLSFNINAQIDFLEWLKGEAVQIISFEKEHLDRIIQLLRKYADVPMDLADSSLMVAAELLDERNVVSIDTDYYVYRTRSKRALNNPLLDFIKGDH